MGKKLDSVKGKQKEAQEQYESGIGLAEQDVDEISGVKGALEGISAEVDDEILAAAESIEGDAVSEADEHMQSEVKEVLNQGDSTSSEAIGEAQEQAQLSEDAQGVFEGIGSSSRFGRGTAETGSTFAESVAEQFEQTSEEIGAAQEAAAEEFEEKRQEILEDK